MNPMTIEILVLAGIAVFLVLRLRSVLGTREGFEKPRSNDAQPDKSPELKVIEGGPDADITDHVPAGSDLADRLVEIKNVDPDFSVTEFLTGARSAYEMILMAFERGEMEEIRVAGDLWSVARGDRTLAQFLSAHGFRGPADGELSSRAWREDPGPVEALVMSWITSPPLKSTFSGAKNRCRRLSGLSSRARATWRCPTHISIASSYSALAYIVKPR